MGLIHSFQASPYAQALVESPYLTSSLALLVTCVVTRIVTGIRSNLAKNNQDATLKKANKVPYWIPFIGSALRVMMDIDGSIAEDRDKTGDGVFSYQMGPTSYYIANMSSLVQQIFAQRESILTKRQTLEWFMKTAFDDKWATRDEREAFHGHHTALNLMLKEDFITEATGKTARAVEVDAARLVTQAPWLSPQGKSMELWEQAGTVRFNPDGTYDADLFHLVCHFMSQIVIDMLWGKALVKNNPQLQVDMWDFDVGVHHIISPLLTNLTKDGRKGVAARERLTVAMKEWHEAMIIKQAGGDPGEKWGKLDDVSQIMQDRVKVWVDKNASEVLQKTNDVSVLWGVNVNSNKNVYWMLMQIQSQPELLSDIREEIAPYVHISPTCERGPDGFPKLSIDVDGLMKNCPLIKASFYETMRMNMSGLGIRQVMKDFVLKEGPNEAALFGKKVAQSYTIPAGSTVVLCNGTMQMDKRLFANPEKFYPERWIEQGPDGKPRAQMRNLHTFGGGLYKCKGRYFAEKEVLIFASALLVMWDISPLEGDELVLPKMGNAGASRSPIGDARVRLTRRYN